MARRQLRDLEAVSGGAARTHADFRPRALARPPGPPLGTTTKSASASTSRVDLETGEIIVQGDPYAKWAEQSTARVALPGHRIQVCMRHVRTDRYEVEVHQSEKSRRSYFSGVMACGSVWVCPVCARKIQAVRAAEVRAAIEEATGRGWQVAMVTQTVRHSRQDILETLLGQFSDALRRFKGRRAYTRLSKAHGIKGSIRALEVTWGQANGWHPHSHTILFLEGGDLVRLEEELRQVWAAAVDAVGLPRGNDHGLVVGDAADVETYLTKQATEGYRWGAEDELVKAHSKRGRGGRFTPFDFLRAYLDEPDSGQMLALFAEFAYTFHGRRQLVWSNGLKRELLGADGLSDQEIADSLGENDSLLGNISLEVWRYIRRRNFQAEVLKVADLHGADGLRRLLEVYEGKVRDGQVSDRRGSSGEGRPLESDVVGGRAERQEAEAVGSVGSGGRSRHGLHPGGD